jgi:CheY-like chemotaxis protein
MPLIVVMEDDAGTRMLVSQVLKKEGFTVMAAENGALGLDLIRQHKPDLVVSDVQMPVMDGFTMLDAVRRDEHVSTTPVILLTSLQERSHMRHGMATGADDYLTKPFSPQELREAVSAQLNKLIRADSMRAMVVDKAVAQALQEQSKAISKLYELRMAKALSDQWPDSGLVKEGDKYANATVLFADIRDYGQWSERLSGEELGDVVKQFYGSVGDTVHLFGAHHMQFVGDGMLCIFVDAGDTESVNHGLRAVRAAVGLGDATRRLDSYIQQCFADRQLPNFMLNVALHSGPVAFAKLDGMFSGSSQRTPVGDTVAAALRLFQSTPPLTWTIAASVQTSRLVTGAVKLGKRSMVQVPGRKMPFDAVEIVGIAK